MRVLLVEDSLSVRAYVEGVLRSAADIELLPPAYDGVTGVKLAVSLRPTVILMDLELPGLSGLQAIQQIMATAPCPIVVLSAHLEAPAQDRAFASLQAGAVDVLSKPRGLDAAAVAGFRDRLLRLVRVMAEARVLRRSTARPSAAPAEVGAAPPADLLLRRGCEIVVIGCSTGAPTIVFDILQKLPRPFCLPIVVAQHIIAGFEHGFASWLGRTGHQVKVVQAGQSIQPGVVHIAPADRHLAVRRTSFELLAAEAGKPMPSVDILFETTADAFGERAVALLLSGMGEDGARGMASLRGRGAFTATQTGKSCVVDGMPAAARARSASLCDLSPGEMAELLQRLSRLAPLG